MSEGNRSAGQLYSRADLQIHTSAGDGMASAVEIFDAVQRFDLLDVVAVTDHDSIRGAIEAREAHARGRYGFDLVTGTEVTTRAGHLLALWVDEPIPSFRPLDRTIAEIHRRGGLAVVPHPFSALTRSVGRRTLERVLAQNDAETRPDGIEVANRTLAGRAGGERARRWNSRYGLAETGGSDAHFLEYLGSAYTLYEGSGADDLRAAIEQRRTFARLGRDVSLRQIGLRTLAKQQVRGLSETPRQVMGSLRRRIGSGSPWGRGTVR